MGRAGSAAAWRAGVLLHVRMQALHLRLHQVQLLLQHLRKYRIVSTQRPVHKESPAGLRVMCGATTLERGQ